MIGRLTLLTLSIGCTLYADTVVLRVKRSGGVTTDTKGTHVLPRTINGLIAMLFENQLTMTARYETGDRKMNIDLKDVETIEFNLSTFNSGPPPQALGVGPPISEAGQASAPSNADTIVIRGQRKPCKLSGIDTEYVRCGNSFDARYERRTVIRVVLGAR